MSEISLPYTQTGGSRIGRSYWLSLNATTPFARLTVTDDGIELRAGQWKRYRFTRNDFQTLEVFNGLISTGLKITHTNSSYPRFMIFWTVPARNLEVLVEVLSKAGYEIC